MVGPAQNRLAQGSGTQAESLPGKQKVLQHLDSIRIVSISTLHEYSFLLIDVCLAMSALPTAYSVAYLGYIRIEKFADYNTIEGCLASYCMIS
jgi:hypothetical protein